MVGQRRFYKLWVNKVKIIGMSSLAIRKQPTLVAQMFHNFLRDNLQASSF